MADDPKGNEEGSTGGKGGLIVMEQAPGSCTKSLGGRGKGWVLWGNAQVIAMIGVKEDDVLHHGLMGEKLEKER